MRVKMLCRHTAKTGKKLEEGLTYDLPPDYARELEHHGLAVLVVETALPMPGFVLVNRPRRSRSGRFLPKGKE